MSKDYEVGHGRPPKHAQFKPGRSGNPRGRPKGSRNFSTDLKATLNERVYVTKGGRRKAVSTQAATLMRLREKALSGDPRALDRYIDLARIYNDAEISDAAAGLGKTDAEILEGFEERLRRRTEKPQEPEELANDQPGNEASAEAKGEDSEEDDDDWLR